MPKGVKGSATHGGTGTKYNEGCRCKPCRQAHCARMKVSRDRRFAGRVWVDGVLIHPDAPVHNASTYGNYGCRCRTCSNAHQIRLEAAQRRYRARKGQKAHPRRDCPVCGRNVVVSEPSLPGGTLILRRHGNAPSDPGHCPGSRTIVER